MRFLATLGVFACAVAFSSAAYADCSDVFGCSERDRFNFEQLANGEI